MPKVTVNPDELPDLSKVGIELYQNGAKTSDIVFACRCSQPTARRILEGDISANLPFNIAINLLSLHKAHCKKPVGHKE